MEYLNDEQIEFLNSYNFIKKDPNLIKIAESLDDQNIYSKLDHNQKFRTISNEIYNNLMISEMLKNESRLRTKKIRVFMDGVFDIILRGHFYALRQGRS